LGLCGKELCDGNNSYHCEEEFFHLQIRVCDLGSKFTAGILSTFPAELCERRSEGNLIGLIPALSCGALCIEKTTVEGEPSGRDCAQ
jgi:hypothetical protein